MVKSGQAVSGRFATSDPGDGAARDADSLPTATLYVDGADTATVVTVTNVTGTGAYSWSATLPALTAGQMVGVNVVATVDAVTSPPVSVWQDVADTAALSDLATAANLATVDGIVDDILLDTGTTLDDKLDAVKLKTDTIGALAVTIQSPVATDGTVTLFQSADYDSDDARSVDFTIPVAGCPDLTGATVKLHVDEATFTAASVATVGTDYVVSFEYTDTETEALTAGVQDYQVWATLTGSARRIPLQTGEATVVKLIAEV
jgi:hypothetical protein